jgi:glycosyltransferase involved in cell wall biosynthesis
MIGGVSASKKAFGKVIPLTVNNDYPNFIRWLKGNVRWDIGIAPLADTAFNTNKSYLKYLEYSAMGMATVCSNSSEYRRVVDSGETGLLVENTTKAWLDALVELVRQPEMRKRLARNALVNVQKNHTLAAKSATVLEVLGITGQ